MRYTLIEYMPLHLRNSHTIAGNSDSWPYNGTERVYIEHEVRASDLDPRWAYIVEDNIREEDIPDTAVKGVLDDHRDAYRSFADPDCVESWED